MKLIKFIVAVAACALWSSGRPSPDIISYTVNLQKQDLQLYWKDDKGQIIGNFKNLQSLLEKNHRELVFAMNAGMYRKDQSPQGLFIQRQKILAPLDTGNGGGNFYLKPNGVFYWSGKKASVVKTEDFRMKSNIDFATQSGPMLVIDGKIHPAFKEGSTNLNVRNGVGILPDGTIIFALSKTEINFYDFAKYFQDLGCKNALYLDGFVSRMYLPEKRWVQTDGSFGVMIGVTKRR